MVDALAALPIGHGLDDGVRVGPLINAEACSTIESLLADAADRGARVRLGGSRPDRTGFFFAPTVLDRVPADARILREEIFGPVAPIVEFHDVEHAVAMANDTEYGLVSYIYTADLKHGLDVAAALESGTVALNRGLVSDPAAPFGGVKQSGIGRAGGQDGVLDYTESKYLAIG